MHTTGDIHPRLVNSFKCFSKFLVDLHNLQTFDSVREAEMTAHERIDIGFEEMSALEGQIVALLQQIAELYARDRQMQISGQNPYEIIIAMDEHNEERIRKS